MSKGVDINVVKARWNDWLERRFPANTFDIAARGFELVEIDTFSAGCISVFVDSGGKLDRKRIDVLRNCVRDLDHLLPDLSTEAKDYFAELSTISHLVLKSVEVAQ